MSKKKILNTAIDVTSYEDAAQSIISWAKLQKSCYVCAANVHMLMEAWDFSEFSRILDEAALVTPDGMPLVWGLRLLGFPMSTRVYGPTLTLRVCCAAAQEQVPIGLYGGTKESLQKFTDFLQKEFPTIEVVCSIAPPFRPLTQEEDSLYTEQIIKSGAKILFVGIGCPKQEYWMAAHKDLIPAVMLGVGAAFDFHSGRVRQAPEILQKLGLEWAFRLTMEPRRLWKRYAYNNPRFVLFFILQWIKELLRSKPSETRI